MSRPAAPPCALLPFLSFVVLSASLFGKVRSLKFTIDRKECLIHHSEEEGALIHGSFVVVGSDNAWGSSFEKAGVDLVVEAPGGYHAYSVRGRSEEQFSFVAIRAGEYRFCFTNHAPIHETIAFDVYSSHQAPTPHHNMHEMAKDEHIDPLLEHVQQMEESVTSLFYECRWLFAHAERQAELSKITSRRLIVKAFLQSAALIGSSTLQVYLLRRLFEKKLRHSRV